MMKRQQGFTLVEIAIVLVIIGLLLGGILRGQELINNARVRNTIDQVNGVKAAYFGFQDRFRLIPGDLNAAGVAVVGNGALAATGAVDGTVAAGDSATVFQNLTVSGFLACGTCTVAGASTAANSPANPYNGFMRISNTADYQVGAGAGPVRMHVATGTGVPSNVLAEIDRKVDDGVSNNGSFVESGFNGAPAACAVGNPGVWAAPPAAQTNCGGASLL
jgi:prepilin-type N-terminal cleavage/methylation domain-containing protein